MVAPASSKRSFGCDDEARHSSAFCCFGLAGMGGLKKFCHKEQIDLAQMLVSLDFSSR
ncbi:hypothetical protein [Geomonas agri]|uniref:hypothetical protein n=1 Tax=Geomonas agri TaxID=2873702 RepID=UPI001CD290A8|nr:hypothetical protein [Geomonas agri]